MVHHQKSEIPPSSFEQWFDLFKKELDRSGKTHTPWRLNDRITIEPLYPSAAYPTPGDEVMQWMPGINFTAKSTNEDVIKALNRGVLSPLIQSNEVSIVEQLLENVIDECVQTIIEVNNPSAYNTFSTWRDKTNRKKTQLWYTGSDRLSDQYTHLICESHDFKEADVDIALADILHRCVHVLNTQIKRADQMVIRLYADGDFYLTVSKFIAFRILWQNLMGALSINHTHIFVDAQLSTKSWTTDHNKNLIISTTQALAAIFGKANRLAIRPADQKTLYNRIAINIHHILLKESLMGQYANPVDGSYYIENMSQTIAASAWRIFTKK